MDDRMSTRSARPDLSPADLHMLSPSPSVRKFGKEIVYAASKRPILDVACGGGRNGALIAYLGGDVLGLNIELERLKTAQSTSGDATLREAFRRIRLLKLDLINDKWPFMPSSVGGIINVHFLHLPLLKHFCDSLIPGGLLIVETVEGRRGNYLELPEAGYLRGIRVEIRVVLHRLSILRLSNPMKYIYRNLSFVEHVALMRLEYVGYTPRNIDELWVDPYDYQRELEKSVRYLSDRGLTVSIYNHQLCVLDPSLWPYAKKSISDWTNMYLPVCESCEALDACGGLFKWAAKKHSKYIHALNV